MFAMSTLGPGGAERVVSLLADQFGRRGHRVAVLTLSCRKADFFAVGPTVERIALNAYGDSASFVERLVANLKRIRRIRRAIRRWKPDVVISFITEMNVLTILACAWLPPRVVLSERVDPAAHPIGRVWSWLRKATYRNADVLVVQTAAIGRWFANSLGARPRIAVIANPVAVAQGEIATSSPMAPPYVLAAGRLVRQKGFDILLQAFALIAQDQPELRLVIAGEGDDAEDLRALGDSLGIADRVRFVGRVHNLLDLMRNASLFVLPSRYEGFPNVLLEALASGVATIAADCPTGPREILAGGRYGILVPPEDPKALAAAIRSLCNDTGLLAKLRFDAPKAVADYNVDVITSRWEKALAGDDVSCQRTS